jgi:hypothetical protein
MASGESLLILKEAFQKLTLGRRKLATWAFFLNIFILQLNVMHAQDCSVDFRHHMLGLGDEEVPVRCPGERLHSTPCRKNGDAAAAPCDRL